MTVGVITRVVPAPFVIPPQEPEYHFHVAPTPRFPPVKLSVDVDPLQIIDGDDDIVMAGEEFVHTKTVLLIQLVVLHCPWALT